MVELRNPVVCVVGPTASGKSTLAQHLALELGGAVLSADSMQIYRGMDIGTGKLAAHERLVEHYGLDLVDPGQAFSAALYQDYGRKVVMELDAKGMPCVVCGGTGFYIRALVDDYCFVDGSQVGNEVRDRYVRMASAEGPEAVWDVLKRLDPESAELIPKADVKRVVRALEMHDQGVSYARQKEQLSKIPAYFPAVFVGLAVDRDELVCAIDERVDRMLEAGLVDEVRGLLDRGFRDALTAQAAIGYKEVVAYLDGRCSLEEAAESIKLATRRYAKRQRTWFGHDARVNWLECHVPASEDEFGVLLERALGLVKLGGAHG